MSVHALLLPELDDLIRRGSPQRQAKTLERVTTFFLDGASSFNKDHLQLFDLVLTRLIDCMERKARTELSFRLAPLGNAPVEAVRRLARDDSIAVAAPVLQYAARLSQTDLIDVIQTNGQGHFARHLGSARARRARHRQVPAAWKSGGAARLSRQSRRASL